MSVLQKSVVILTGASRGIGLSILHYLLRNNARVVALSRTTTPELESLQQTHADSLLLCKGDVATEADNKRVVDLALAKFGQIDALIRKLASLYSPKIHSHLVNFAVNAATLSPLGTTASMHTSARLEEYRKLFEINYFSLISIIAHALPSLNLVKAGQDASLTGRIILVSSGAATKGVAGWGAYSSSKAAMNSLARTLGSEEKTVVTIAVRPGVVDTDMQTAIRETGKAHMSAADHTNFSGLKTSGSLLSPDQPAAVLAGLALGAELSLSGEFVSWDDKAMEKFVCK